MKRYEPAVEHGSPVMEPYSLGDWVRYEDAKKVVDALSWLVEFSAGLDELVRKTNGKLFLGEPVVIREARAALKQINGE